MDKAIRATIKERKHFYRDYCFEITNAYFVYHKTRSCLECIDWPPDVRVGNSRFLLSESY